MNLELTPELEQLIESSVKSGRYKSANELVLEALRLFEERDEVFRLRRHEIRKQIEEGCLSAENSELVDEEGVFNRLDSELELMERSTEK
jgi:antitoxin ParD1/3/4